MRLQEIIKELQAMNAELKEMNDKAEEKEKEKLSEYIRGFRDGWAEGMKDAKDIIENDR